MITNSSVAASLQIFTPRNINNLEGWFDASDTSTITESSGKVSQWDDKSGNSNNAVQPNAGLQCDTGVDSQNSKNVLTFSLNMSLLTSIDMTPSSNDISVSVMRKFDLNDSPFRGVCSQWSSPSNREFFIGKNNSSNFSALVPGASSISSSVSVLSYKLITLTMNNSSKNNSLYVNGSFSASQSSSPESHVQDFFIGGTQPGNENFSGQIGEIILSKSLFSDSTLYKLSKYCKSKWGIS